MDRPIRAAEIGVTDVLSLLMVSILPTTDTVSTEFFVQVIFSKLLCGTFSSTPLTKDLCLLSYFRVREVLVV